MNKKLIISALGLFLILGNALHSNNLKHVHASTLADEHTLILYDAGSGDIPGAPAMNFIDFPADVASLTYLDGGTVLDTTELGSDTYAGWISNQTSVSGFPILDRTIGFQVDFTIRVEDELHQNNNRAGFSIIVLSDGAVGVELAFWEDQIWVQNDDQTGGLFSHGEGVAFATNTGLIAYQLRIAGDSYTLLADTKPILTGPLRNYGLFEGFPDPYETPNFLFMGDDTTSAQARIQLSFVSITGVDPIMPVVTDIPTSTSIPSATEFPTSLPNEVPVASPTSGGGSNEICPSGWIMLPMILTAGWLSKRRRWN